MWSSQPIFFSPGCLIWLRSGKMWGYVITLRSFSCSVGRSGAVLLFWHCPVGGPSVIGVVFGVQGCLRHSTLPGNPTCSILCRHTLSRLILKHKVSLNVGAATSCLSLGSDWRGLFQTRNPSWGSPIHYAECVCTCVSKWDCRLTYVGRFLLIWGVVSLTERQ